MINFDNSELVCYYASMSNQDNKKQQFNIYLPSDLIKQVKFAALESDKSLSRFVEDVLRRAVEQAQEKKDKKQ